MKWFEKIKEGAIGVFKEHPASVCVFFISAVLAGIKGDFGTSIGKGPVANILQFIYLFTLLMTPAFVLCESNYAYKKKAGKIESLFGSKKSAAYVVVTVVGIVVSAVYAYIHSFRYREYEIEGTALCSFNEYFTRILYVYLAVCVLSALFFMYKKHGTSFEKYALRAFLGIMKACLVYGIILLGSFCILWVFSVLFFDLEIESIILWLVTGIVGFPALLMGVSAPGEKTGRFAEIVMGYVFPGILAAAFVIVYAYIIKILITWTFPSNQVFTIATALFVAGLAFWTMAQGCTEGKIAGYLKVMPLLFIPFIVIQIMCLSMRIGQYGITGSRYLGILLIIFGIIYEGYYIFRFIKKEGLGGILMPLLLLFVAVYFIIPKVNVYAVITASQKVVVEKYINAQLSGDKPDSVLLSRARSAYREIARSGGLEGEHYLRKLYAKTSKDEVENMLGASAGSSDDYEIDRSFFVYTDCHRASIDTEGYKYLCHLECNSSDEDNENSRSVHLENQVSGEGPLVVLDLSDIIKQLKELEKNDVEGDEQSKIIEKPVKTDNGTFYIEYINFHFDENDEDNKIKDLVVEGFYLYN